MRMILKGWICLSCESCAGGATTIHKKRVVAPFSRGVVAGRERKHGPAGDLSLLTPVKLVDCFIIHIIHSKKGHVHFDLRLR